MIMCGDFNASIAHEQSKIERLDNNVHAFGEDDFHRNEFDGLADECPKDLILDN